jgi:hypothetical protein
MKFWEGLFNSVVPKKTSQEVSEKPGASYNFAPSQMSEIWKYHG